MRYIVLLLLLLTMSCSKSPKEMDKGAIKTGKHITDLWFHKSDPWDEVKGPVRELKYFEHRVDGDTVAYVIKELNNIDSLNGRRVIRYNKEGYVTYHESWDEFNSFYKILDHITNHYRYNSLNVITTQEKHLHRKKTSMDRKVFKGEDKSVVKTEYVFGKNSSKKIISQGLDTIIRRARVETTDSAIVFNSLADDGKKVENSSTYLKGVDGKFRLQRVWDTLYKQIYVYEFKDNRLYKRIETDVNHGLDSSVVFIEYNLQGDPIRWKKQGEEIDGIPNEERLFRYTYDEHNNWIEKVTFVNGKAKHAVCREITYW